MRLAEAAGLKADDLNLEHQCPYPTLKPYVHRSRKTKASERVIPLVGASLWAAKRIILKSDSDFCFPRYTDHSHCNSNSASAAINKWIKTVTRDESVIHGLRHSFRDRLRSVEASTEAIDQLGGWSFKTVGQSYGNGHTLELLSKWMNKIII